MTKQIEKNNNNNSSLSLINPQTAPYKLPLPVNKTIHLNFVNRKQQVLTIFLASFSESVLIWFLNHCHVYSICQKENICRWVESPRLTPLYKNEGKRSDMTNYSLISIIPVAGKKIDQNLNWDDDIQMIFKNFRLLQASVQLSMSETLSLVTILSCSCTCTASLQLQFGEIVSNKGLSQKLQKLQNCAARIITTSNYNACLDELFQSLNWHKLELPRKFDLSILMYKTFYKNETLENLSSKFINHMDLSLIT